MKSIVTAILFFLAISLHAQVVSLSINNATMNEATGSAIVTATLDTTVASDVVVNLAVSGDVSAGDYSMASAITILANELYGTTTITPVDDNVSELTESMLIDIDSVTNATESGTQQVTTQITDDEALPSITLTTSSTNVSEDTGVAQFIVTASGASDRAITVNMGFSGSATNGTDYTTSGTSAVIPAGNTIAGLSIFVSSDTAAESTETIVGSITTVTNATENGTQEESFSLLDNDTVPTVSLIISDSAIAEKAGTCTVTAQLSQAIAYPVTVTLAVTGTASSSDYSISSSLITITPGETSSTVTVTATDDTADDNDETIILDIDSVTNGTESGTQQQTITITDDETSSYEGGGSVCALQSTMGYLPMTALLCLILFQRFKLRPEA